MANVVLPTEHELWAALLRLQLVLGCTSTIEKPSSVKESALHVGLLWCICQFSCANLHAGSVLPV